MTPPFVRLPAAEDGEAFEDFDNGYPADEDWEPVNLEGEEDGRE